MPRKRRSFDFLQLVKTRK